MLRADFPKENIDGEAIEWALSRLLDVDRRRKILVVLSDGAPVDDSTLKENGPDYLSDHLGDVVEGISNGTEVEIAAFGIGFKAHPFYPHSHHVEEPSQLGGELLMFITDLLLSTEGSAAMSALREEPTRL